MAEPAGPESAAGGEESDVWYEFLSTDRSAMQVHLHHLADGETVAPADAERLVWRPGAGLDGWTPMREALESQRASMQSHAAGEEEASPARGSGAGAEASSAVAAEPSSGVGTPFNVLKWRPQFGLPLVACECAPYNGFGIPTILLALWSALRARGGLEEEGIFRLAPDATACEALKQSLNTDGAALSRIGAETDPHVLANLIKIWFRMLPERLLTVASKEQINACETGADCMELLQTFPTPAKGLFVWLLDVMADVASCSSSNKMSVRAVAIVVAPNLYDPPSDEGEPPRLEPRRPARARASLPP